MRIRAAYATPLVLACLLGGGGLLRAADMNLTEPAPTPPAAKGSHKPPVHDPAATFAKRLKLDAKQQAQVSRLLTMRKEQIHKVWSDPAIAPDDRVSAVKSINEKTIEQIRSLLTDEQKQKYFQPKPVEGAPAPEGPSASEWLDKLNSHKPDASTPH